MTPLQQTQQFIEFMLEHTSELEFAAAHYTLPPGAEKSKVDWLIESRMRVRSLKDLAKLLPWLRAQNASELNIWVRPACSLQSHPFLMLDDLPVSRALVVARKYRAAVVQTSPGNAQVWIVCSRELGREQRQDVARALCDRTGSDSGAISEPRWGRLPGFRQQKPEKPGSWTNLLAISDTQLFDPTPYHVGSPSLRPSAGRVVPSSVSDGVDASRREFAYACHALRAGVPAHIIEEKIAARVSTTGRRKSRDYARRTVAAAQRAG